MPEACSMSTYARTTSIARWSNPIELDQAGWNACIPAAVTRVLQLQNFESGKPHPELSTQYSFNDSVYLNNYSDALNFNVVMRSMSAHGVPLASDYPWLAGYQNQSPPPDWITARAFGHTITGYSSITVSQNGMINAALAATQISHGAVVLISTRNIPFLSGDTIIDGHELAVDTINFRAGTVSGFNSYGPTWHGDGRFDIRISDFVNRGADGLTSMNIITGFDGADWSYTKTKTDVAELYVDLFFRPVDGGGQKWYSNLIDAEHLTLTNAANGLCASAEGRAIFDPLTHNQQANALANNIIGWGDTGYYAQKLDNGLSLGDIAAMMSSAVHAGAAGQIALDRLVNRTNASDWSGHFQIPHASLVGVTDNADTVEVFKSFV